MHVEDDDVPEYLRTKKQGPSRALAIVAIGSVITGVLMMIFAKPVVIDVAQLKKAIRFADQPVFDEPARVVEQAPMPQPIAPQYRQQQRQPIVTQYTQHQSEPSTLWVPRGSTSEQKPQVRQRSFNDRNYTSKNPINIVKFENQPSPVVEAPSRSKTTVTIIRQPDRKDVCDVWNAGSLRRRECRRRVDLESRNRS